MSFQSELVEKALSKGFNLEFGSQFQAFNWIVGEAINEAARVCAERAIKMHAHDTVRRQLCLDLATAILALGKPR